ncbi:hypothetical protein Tco_0455265 [Tanacetum coccineum]
MEEASLLTQNTYSLLNTTDKHGLPPRKRLVFVHRVTSSTRSPHSLVHGESLEIWDYQLCMTFLQNWSIAKWVPRSLMMDYEDAQNCASEERDLRKFANNSGVRINYIKFLEQQNPPESKQSWDCILLSESKIIEELNGRPHTANPLAFAHDFKRASPKSAWPTRNWSVGKRRKESPKTGDNLHEVLPWFSQIYRERLQPYNLWNVPRTVDQAVSTSSFKELLAIMLGYLLFTSINAIKDGDGKSLSFLGQVKSVSLRIIDVVNTPGVMESSFQEMHQISSLENHVLRMGVEDGEEESI